MKLFVVTCVLLVAIGLAHARPGHGGYNFGAASGSMGQGPTMYGKIENQFDNGVNAEAHFHTPDSSHYQVGGSVGYSHNINENVQVYGKAGVEKGYGGKTQQNYQVGVEAKF